MIKNKLEPTMNLETLKSELARARAENRSLRAARGLPAPFAADEILANAVEDDRPVVEAVEHRDLKSKDWTRYGVRHEGERDAGHHADVVPGVSVKIHGHDDNHRGGPVDYDKLYKIGDRAEYDSWNLHYYGTIVAIGKTTVTIEAHDRRRRLDLLSFSRHNRGDDERKHNSNVNWMD